MKTEFDQIYLETAADWRNWLVENWDMQKGVWLIYYKKHTGKPRVVYNDAVEEALCFGWIDSTVKRIDDERYMQQFTPRNTKSNWSDLNKKRIEKLFSKGKMMPPGIKSVDVAKQNGKWYETDRPAPIYELSPEILNLLQSNQKAYDAFLLLTPSKRKLFTNWVMSAKRIETQQKRSNEMIELLINGDDVGMK